MIRKFIKYVRDEIKNPEREFSERVFIIFSILSVITVSIALIGDLIIGESIGEIVTLIAIIIVVPLVTFTCLYKNKVKLAIRLLVTCLLVGILPALFFFGGGLEGGGVLWFIFAFMYVGLVLSGKWRRAILILLIILSFGCYYDAYYFPNLIAEHTKEQFYTDNYISLVLVGFLCFFMTWSQNRLYQDVNDRAKKEAERAEELSRAQNRFFSNMSHEIRTPINSILGLNELILRDQSSSEEVIRDAAGIQGAGKMLLALINDILDFSKMEAGSMDIVPVDYRVDNLLSEVVNMIWLKAHDKGLKFEVSVDPKVPAVLYGDEVRIKQIIINLLNNAVKYTAEGSVELHIENEEAEDNTTMLLISVSDTGMGIKKEVIPYLFDAFKRVDEEKNRYIEGTGLGLSIVKQLVELMGGNITVNSVYGEGSTFTVTVKQGVSDKTLIGELNIQSQQVAKRSQYESSFKAPEAKILIVDDNEMNLEVEKKLLTDTGLTIDTVLSGRAALEMTLKTRYDVILMDHLMPEMDGIECLECIKNQTGGLNRTTPVVVLTANAGSDNRELYSRSGFYGYLVKPVSGEALEDTLMKYIPKEKLKVTSKIIRMREDINTLALYARKAPVIITSTSMCDLPEDIVQKLNVPIIPFRLHTESGVFKDGIQMDANELIRFMNDGKAAISAPPEVGDYTEFFASALKHAHHLIHIALSPSVSEDYKRSCEAAKSFDNVTVINSECLSSSMGMLVLIASKLSQQGIPVEDIIDELETVKKRLRCSFVIDTTEYMANRGIIGPRQNTIAKTLNIHPCLRMKEDRYTIGGFWFGNTKKAYASYVRNAFPVDIIPDEEVVFITYADVPMETLLWVKEEISKYAYFEHVVFQQASAAVTSNCGPGTIGILYFVKSNKSYNIGSLIGSDEEAEETAKAPEYSASEPVEQSTNAAPEEEPAKEELKWYQKLEVIDGDQAVKNSGSEDAFAAILKIFVDSVDNKAAELDEYFEDGDWVDYTIKVHALKSSARLIGAEAVAEEAQLLETAGKEGNTGYIRQKHENFMMAYRQLGDHLKKALGGAEEEKAAEAADEKQKPVADSNLMQSVYEDLKSAAEAMDCDTIGEIIKELDDYSIPEEDREKFEAIREKAGKFDYDGILAVLDNK